MNGSFRKKPNGSVELRVWLDMPDGSHVQKSFCRRTRALAKAAYEEFLERGKEAQAHAPNEKTWKEDLVRCAAVYAALPSEYCR